MARATPEEKKQQLDNVEKYKADHEKEAALALENLRQGALDGKNIFAALMEAARHCSLYQMSQALFEVGGQYRRNI